VRSLTVCVRVYDFAQTWIQKIYAETAIALTDYKNISHFVPRCSLSVTSLMRHCHIHGAIADCCSASVVLQCAAWSTVHQTDWSTLWVINAVRLR